MIGGLMTARARTTMIASEAKKLAENNMQCQVSEPKIALLTKQGIVSRAAAVDRLWEIAIAHALVRALGEDRVQAIISEAFAVVLWEAA
jgi:hypothetical protein